MSNLRNTLGSLLSIVDKGGSALAGLCGSGLDSLDMLNARIASAKVTQAAEIEQDEIYRLAEIKYEAEERMTALIEKSDVLASTKPEALDRAHAYIEEQMRLRAEAKAAKATQTTKKAE